MKDKLKIKNILNILIIVVVVLTIGAVGYAIYYNIKNNSSSFWISSISDIVTIIIAIVLLVSMFVIPILFSTFNYLGNYSYEETKIDNTQNEVNFETLVFSGEKSATIKNTVTPLLVPPYCVLILEISSPVNIASNLATFALAMSTPSSASVLANKSTLYCKLLLYSNNSLFNFSMPFTDKSVLNTRFAITSQPFSAHICQN